MLRASIVVLAACGGAAQTPIAEPARSRPIVRHPGNDTIPLDPIVALAPAGPDDEISWLVPGPVQLEIGSSMLDPSGAPAELPVRVIDRQGSAVRVAVWLPTSRFSVWTDRASLLAVLLHDQRVTFPDTGFVDVAAQDPIEVVLHTGARVRRLGHKDHVSQIRYYGALEVDGWLPDAALGDRALAPEQHGRIPSGQQTLMVVPGTVIRTEPKWAASQLAIMANDYFLDTIRSVNDGWVEVSYRDGDLRMHGYASRHDPPGRLHNPNQATAAARTFPATTPNAKATSGTCLYAREGGDPIGYLVGDQPVELAAGAGAHWWSLVIETPWGPTTFAASGPVESELVACAPAGTVPPPAPSVP